MTHYMAFEEPVVGARACPFCGGEEIAADRQDFYVNHHLHVLRVKCKGCGAMVESGRNLGYEGAFENALEKWNRRPGDGTDGQ